MLAGLFPFVLFLCAVIGLIVAVLMPWFWVTIAAIPIFGLGSSYFFNKKNFFAAEIFLLIIFVLIFAAWAQACARNSLDRFYTGDHIFNIKVITVPRPAKRFNICLVKIDGFSEKIKIVDYTRRLDYLGRYEISGSLVKRLYHGCFFYLIFQPKDAKIKCVDLNFLERTSRDISRYTLKRLKDNFSDMTYRFLSSLFLGRYELLYTERQIFIDTGTTHLLAISGLHMVLVSATIFFILGLFGLSHSFRLVVASLVIFGYTFLSGISPSALRAAIMFSVLSMGFFLRRTSSSLNILGIAGVISFIGDPQILVDIGFQLSYLSIFALALFSYIFPQDREGNFFINEFEQLFNISLWVGIFLLPVVSYYFGKIYIGAFMYNIVLIPLCNLILLIVFIMFCFFPVKFLLLPLAAVLEPLSVFFIYLNKSFGSGPLSSCDFRFNLFGVCLYYIVFMAVFIFYRYNKKHEKI